jgi:two-component system LytT family response regulator
MVESRVKTLVVDDEPLARALLVDLLKRDKDIEVIGECGNGTDALKAIRKMNPDIVFLDVQMPEMNGLAVLEKLQDQPIPIIVFVTAYDQYAIRAFDFHAVDYLLKPFSRPRFEKALGRAKEQAYARFPNDDLARQQISSLLDIYKSQSASIKRLFLKEKGRIVLLEPEQIDWVESDDKYVRIHSSNKSYLIRQTLNSLERELDPHLFARIHRSNIVNLTRVKELKPFFNGEYILVLSDGKKLMLSRNYKTRFFEQLGKVG